MSLINTLSTSAHRGHPFKTSRRQLHAGLLDTSARCGWDVGFWQAAIASKKSGIKGIRPPKTFLDWGGTWALWEKDRRLRGRRGRGRRTGRGHRQRSSGPWVPNVRGTWAPLKNPSSISSMVPRVCWGKGYRRPTSFCAARSWTWDSSSCDWEQIIRSKTETPEPFMVTSWMRKVLETDGLCQNWWKTLITWDFPSWRGTSNGNSSTPSCIWPSVQWCSWESSWSIHVPVQDYQNRIKEKDWKKLASTHLGCRTCGHDDAEQVSSRPWWSYGIPPHCWGRTCSESCWVRRTSACEA